MSYPSLFRAAQGATLGLVVAFAAFGCTMKSQEPPDWTGPSEHGTSITVAASPDILAQDGVSRSEITVTARGPNGEPLANRSMIVDIWVGGAHAEFGTLSQRNITTVGDGTARLLYTAPPSPPLSTVPSIDVQIAVVPIGTDAGNNTPRLTTIRVIPQGQVVPPDGLAPYFTVAPTSPQENQQALFSACADANRPPCAPLENPIAEYRWNFGDGAGASGQFATHAYAQAGSYPVTLEVVDHFGRRALTAQQITVGAGVGPTAFFNFSPTEPVANQTISFNATGSTASAGRQIVSYAWDFGTGAGLQPGGATITHRYTAPGTYTVTLVVTDDVGKTSSTSLTVTVNP